MKKEIDSSRFSLSQNQIIVDISKLDKNIKVVDALLKIKVSNVSNNTNKFQVDYIPQDETNQDIINNWKNLDTVENISDTITLNVSDEIQDALDRNTKMTLKFVSDQTITFENSTDNIINIDYISVAEFQENSSYHNVDMGKSGTANINLATGKLNITTPLTTIKNNTVSLPVFANYTQNKNENLKDTGLPENWSLNVHQFLIEHKDNETDTSLNGKFTYVDENGKEQKIEEKYFYFDKENKKHYVTRSQLYVDANGTLLFKDDQNIEFKIETSLEGVNGLKLVSSIKDLKGSDLVDFEIEEVAKQKELLKQLTLNRDNLSSNIFDNYKQLIINKLTEKATTLRNNVQKEGVTYNENYISLQKDIETIKGLLLKRFRNFNYLNDPTAADTTETESETESNNAKKCWLEKGDGKYFDRESIKKLLDTLKDPAAPQFDDNYFHDFKLKDYYVLANILANESSIIYSLGLDYKNLSDKNDDNFESQLQLQEKSNEANKTIYQSSINNQMISEVLNNSIKQYATDIYGNKVSDEKQEFINSLMVGEETIKKISDQFNQGHVIYYGITDILNLDLQNSLLLKNILKSKKDLLECETQIQKAEEQLKILEMQVPVHYLYSQDNVVYGFGKTSKENVYRLVYITDTYDNALQIIYKDLEHNIIDYISDTNNTISFKYTPDTTSDCKLTEIIDTKDNVIKFAYNGDLLTKISFGDTKCLYFYKDKLLCTVLNENGLGTTFEYDNGKISKAQAVSVLKKVENGKISYKDNLDTTKLETISDFAPYLLNDDFVSFDYIDYKSTKLTNAKNKVVTYVFDNYGNIRTIYENEFKENAEAVLSKATSFVYQDKKVSQKIISFPYSNNYLEDSFFSNGKRIENAFYLGTTVCSDETIPFTYETCKTFHTLNENTSTKKDIMSVSSKHLDIINNLDNNTNNCNHRAFMVSGWAKANSAFVITHEDKNSYPNVANRKFEIRVEVTYEGNAEPVEFKNSFDWRNINWQYCSVPVILENKKITKIDCVLDYTDNTGLINYTDLEFKEADFEEIIYENELPKEQFSAHSKWKTIYEYDKYDRVIKTTIFDSSKYSCLDDIPADEKFKTIYEYTKGGSLLRTIDYNGIIKENIYNDNGFKIKTITYHKDEPTSKFYEEQPIDEQGNVTGEINELGESVYSYENVSNSNIIANVIDSKGIKTSYGYNGNDTLLETSCTLNGINNVNTYGYTLDFLTSLKHNDFDITYDYDEQGRVKNIKVAENEYLSKSYNKNEETTTLGSGEIYRQTLNDEGNVLDTYYKKDVNSEEELLSQNIYDTLGNLVFTKNADGTTDKFFIDKFGNTYKTESDQHNKLVKAENVYDEDHSTLIKTTISIGEDTQTYTYANDTTKPTSQLLSVTLPNAKVQTIKTDKLNRISELNSDNYGTRLTYMKNGDHTSNLVSLLEFSKEDKIFDRYSYKYDSKGNITEIRNNGLLFARYTYDSLNRLLREDNKPLNKTFTFEYDAGGNIITKTEYEFTLLDNLDYETGIPSNYVYATNGWRDQLIEFNGKKIEYDALGNPNKYKEIELKFGPNRRLKKFGNVAMYEYNSKGIRTKKIINTNAENSEWNGDDKNTYTINYYLNGNKIIRQEDASNVMNFYYGVDGLVGFNLNGQEYIYKKNLQGDIIGIYNPENKLIAKYIYDAWGNHKIQYLNENNEFVDIEQDYEYNDITNLNRFVAFKNPFRYRSYYFDYETGLYYLNSRYYDPDTSRFINTDDICTLDSTKDLINGLNLYCYCLNNPVNTSDDNGNMPNWLKWLLGIGAGIVAVAATVLTLGAAGIAIGGIAGAIIQGAATGALIGAAIGTVGGAIAGGIYSAVTGLDFWTSVAYGMIAGFGIGAIAGAVIGGTVGYINYTPTQITGFTKHGINNAISKNGHGVNERALLDAIKNPKNIISQSFNSKFKFVGKDAVVVLNKVGKVITTWAKNRTGWRLMIGLWLGLNFYQMNSN